jgi:hypothetical protein
MVEIKPKSFPIYSLLSLLYPNIATYFFTKFKVTLLESVGYALTQTSYVLFVAIVFGTFGIFGLYNRKNIFITAISCFITGVILSNV